MTFGRVVSLVTDPQVYTEAGIAAAIAYFGGKILDLPDVPTENGIIGKYIPSQVPAGAIFPLAMGTASLAYNVIHELTGYKDTGFKSLGGAIAIYLAVTAGTVLLVAGPQVATGLIDVRNPTNVKTIAVALGAAYAADIASKTLIDGARSLGAEDFYGL